MPAPGRHAAWPHAASIMRLFAAADPCITGRSHPGACHELQHLCKAHKGYQVQESLKRVENEDWSASPRAALPAQRRARTASNQQGPERWPVAYRVHGRVWTYLKKGLSETDLTAGSAARSSTSAAPATMRPTTRFDESNSGAAAVVMAKPAAGARRPG